MNSQTHGLILLLLFSFYSLDAIASKQSNFRAARSLVATTSLSTVSTYFDVPVDLNYSDPFCYGITSNPAAVSSSTSKAFSFIFQFIHQANSSSNDQEIFSLDNKLASTASNYLMIYCLRRAYVANTTIGLTCRIILGSTTFEQNFTSAIYQGNLVSLYLGFDLNTGQFTGCYYLYSEGTNASETYTITNLRPSGAYVFPSQITMGTSSFDIRNCSRGLQVLKARYYPANFFSSSYFSSVAAAQTLFQDDPVISIAIMAPPSLGLSQTLLNLGQTSDPTTIIFGENLTTSINAPTLSTSPQAFTISTTRESNCNILSQTYFTTYTKLDINNVVISLVFQWVSGSNTQILLQRVINSLGIVDFVLAYDYSKTRFIVILNGQTFATDSTSFPAPSSPTLYTLQIQNGYFNQNTMVQITNSANGLSNSNTFNTVLYRSATEVFTLYIGESVPQTALCNTTAADQNAQIALSNLVFAAGKFNIGTSNCPTGCSFCGGLLPINYTCFGTCTSSSGTHFVIEILSCVKSGPKCLNLGSLDVCQTCVSGCTYCSTSSHCSICRSGYSVSGSTCSAGCSTAALRSAGCTACDSTNCYVCGSSSYLYNYTCVTSCPPGYFANSATKTCDHCATNCSTCMSPAIVDCSLCLTGYQMTNGFCQVVISTCQVDQDCTNNAPTTPYCNWGICEDEMASCQQDSDCSGHPSNPSCVTKTCQPASCTEMSDCSSYTSAPYCNNPTGGSDAGTCQAATCQVDQDCINNVPTTPYCNWGICEAELASCQQDSDCRGYPSNPSCVTNTCQPASCTEMADCRSYTSAPYCNNPNASTNAGTCQAFSPCQTNTDCITNAPTTPHCVLPTGGANGGTCEAVKCSKNPDCTTNYATTNPVCNNPTGGTDTGTCQAATCQVDQDCTTNAPTTPYCNSGICEGELASCQQDSDCSGYPSNPSCVTNTCQPASCTEMSDCSSYTSTPYCNNPTANTNAGTCQVATCQMDQDCANNLPATPYCNWGICEAKMASCQQDSDCSGHPSNPSCVTNTCQLASCTEMPDCSSYTSAPYCNNPTGGSDAGACQAATCQVDQDCTNNAPTTPYCNWGICEAKMASCQQDSDCRGYPSNPSCVTNTCQPASCTKMSDCSSYSSVPYCNNPNASTNAGTCQAFSPCQTNTDCITNAPTTPHCVLPTGRPNEGTCEAVKCSKNPDCTTNYAKTNPVCNNPTGGTNTGTCQAATCQVDQDCTTNAPTTPYCNWGICEAKMASCQQDSDCSGYPSNPSCVTNTCQPASCTEMSDCSSYTSTPYCNNPTGGTDTGTCQAATCQVDQDCTNNVPTTPYCNWGICEDEMASCQQDSDCSGHPSNPSCVTNTCKPASCTEMSDCSSYTSAPYCNNQWGGTDTGTCQAATCQVDLDCTNNVPATPYCNWGICEAKMASCQQDSDCSGHPSNPSCVTNTCQSASCTEMSDCSSFTSTPYCNNPTQGTNTGTCQAAICQADQDCTNNAPTTPYCNWGLCEAEMASCQQDSDCSGHPSNPSCVTNTCQPASCTEISDCRSFTSAPYCNNPWGGTDTGTCQAATCQVDQDCINNVPTTPYCNWGTCEAKMASCQQDADCSGHPSNPSCVTNTCQPASCTKMTDCSSFTSAPYCDNPTASTNAGTCQAFSPCQTNTDCTTNAPTTPNCVLPTGGANGGTCEAVLCSQNADCTTNYATTNPLCIWNPTWGTYTGTCQAAGCQVDQDCINYAPTTPYCNLGICEAKMASCQQDSDCSGHPSNPSCVTNLCHPASCTKISDCSSYTSAPYCHNPTASTNAGTCQAFSPCQTNTDCTTNAPTTPNCVLPTGRTNGGTCEAVQCSKNADCTTNYATTNPVCNNPTGGTDTGTCQAATCQVDQDCTNNAPTTPYCNWGICEAKMASCQQDSDCSGYPSNPSCVTNTCHPASCTKMADCRSYSSVPSCNNPTGGTNAGACQAATCQVDQDCTNNVPTTPYCNWGICEAKMASCQQDSDCSGHPSNPSCVTNTCQPASCTKMADCRSFTSAPYCNNPTPSTNAGTCQAFSPCQTNTDCITNAPTTPHCVPPTGGANGGTCEAVKCSQNADCTVNYATTNPVCNNPTGGTDTGTCQAATCQVDQDCTTNAPTTPYCNSGICEAEMASCQQDSDCSGYPSNPSCVTNTCQPASCTEMSDCSSYTSTPYCNNPTASTNAGTCQAAICQVDQDCTNNVPTTPYCNWGICEAKMASCQQDSDCSGHPSNPSCVTNTCQLASCTEMPDCSSYTSAPYCHNPTRGSDAGTCQAATCQVDQDCTNNAPTTPYCNWGICEAELASCQQDSDCRGYPSNPSCVTNTCQPASCTKMSDCSSYTSAPYCNNPTASTNAGTCQAFSPCQTNTDCITNAPTTPHCVRPAGLTNGGTCVAVKCSKNPDCTTNYATTNPVCNNPTGGTNTGTCQAATCQVDQDCTTNAPTTPYCNWGICEAKMASCQQDSDCSGYPSNPSCVTNTCHPASCTKMSDCRAYISAPSCNNPTGGTNSGTCQAATCQVDQDCTTNAPTTPYCNWGRCEANMASCQQDSDCSGHPSNPSCVTNTCHPASCTKISDCISYTSAPYCNNPTGGTNTGTCQPPSPCLTDTDCTINAPTTPHCVLPTGNAKGGTCSTTCPAGYCRDSSVNACVSCKIVDAGNAASPANTYPTLSSAISALLDSSNTIHGANIILLKASCIFVQQTLPLMYSIQGAADGTSSLSITFEDAPVSFNDSSNCSLLPTLSLSSSPFSFTNFASISITGLNILYVGVTSFNTFSGVSSLTISQFCFNNSEPFDSPSDTNANFQITSSSQFVMKNGIYLFDAFKTLEITKTPQVIVQQVLFKPLTSMVDNSNDAISIIGDPGFNYILNISAFQVVCDNFSTVIVMPYVFSVSNLANVWISSFSVTNCNFNGVANIQELVFMNGKERNPPRYFIGVTQSTNLSVVNVTVSNINYGTNSGTNHLQAFIYSSAVTNATLCTFKITDLVIYSPYTYAVSFIYFDDFFDGQSAFTFSGWNLNQSSITVSTMVVYGAITTFSNFGGLTFQNFAVDNCDFYWKAQLFNISFTPPSIDSLTYPISYIILQNFSVVQTQISTNELFFTNYDEGGGQKSIELLRYEVTNFTFLHNSVTKANIFHTEGVAMMFTNLTVINNTFTEGSNFILHENLFDTVFVSNGIFHNLGLSGFSVLINTNFTANRYLALESSYDMGNDNGIHAETRPYIVYNCSFRQINISSNSYLLASTSPTTLIRNNSFTNISLDTSGIAELGNYAYFLSDQSYFVEFWNNTYKYAFSPPWSISAFAVVEISLFEAHQNIYTAYTDSRNSIRSYDPGSTLFFICVQENLIDTVQATDSPALVTFNNFDILNGTVFAFNNTFMNITASGSTTSNNIFTGNAVPKGNFLYNNISNSNIAGYGFALSTTELDSFLIAFNQFTEVQNLAFISAILASCQDIIIQNNQFVNITLNGAFFSIQSQQLTGQFLLQGSNFQNITLLSNPNVLGGANFFSITITQASGSPNSFILIEDNSFSTINVSIADGYSQSIYQSAFITIFSVQCIFRFSNNTLNTIAVNSQGSIMILAIANITIINSLFSNLLFGSPNGAFNLVSENLTVSNCGFTNNKNYNSAGIGLFRLVSPKSSSVLGTVIQNSSFTMNSAALSTILSTQVTQITLQMINNQLSNNLMTTSGGLLSFANMSKNSSITVSGLNVTQSRQGTYTGYELVNIFSISSAGVNVTLNLQNVNVTVSGYTSGNLIAIDTNQYITIEVINLTYLSVPSNQSQMLPMFGLLDGNNFLAYFENLLVKNGMSAGTPLFTFECDVLGKTNPIWNLTLNRSSFTNLSLADEIILINSDADQTIALDNFNILIINCTFSNITWTESRGGVITAATSSLGRGVKGTGYAIIIRYSSFGGLNGTGGLIYGGLESIFGSLLWLNDSSFVSINATSTGAILSPSLSILSSYQSIQQSSITQDNASFKITGNFFSNINAQAGTLLYWKSQTRGISLFTANNTFARLYSKQTGGLIYSSYGTSTLPTSVCESYLVIINSLNDTFNTIYSESGSILYAEGATSLFQQTFTNGSFINIQAGTNGSIICMNSVSSSSASSSDRRLLQSSEKWLGNISLIGSVFQNISAQNGAIIYENTVNNTLVITTQSNDFNSISASQRGGICYLNNPMISFSSNTFSAVSAQYAGTIFYSLSDDTDLSNFTTINVVPLNSTPLFAFAPTNLDIKFISLADLSSYPLENDDTPPYNLIVPNLTSFSLTEYMMQLTLIYRGVQGAQIVYDSSQNVYILLTFSTMSNTNPQNFWMNNCSNSACMELPATISLKGKAGDLVQVNATYKSDSFLQFQQFYLSLRACIPGELNQTEIAECVLCPPGKYSLNISDLACSECPTGVICQGGANIIIQQGYYRSKNTTTLNVLSCNDSGARCMGGHMYNNTCSEQYTGPLCSQCNNQNGYLKYGGDDCSRCDGKVKLIVVGTLLLLFAITYQLVMVIVTYKENKKSATELSENSGSKGLQAGSFMVILTTFTQIFSTIADFNIGVFTSFINISLSIGNPNSQAIFYLECLYYLYVQAPFQSLQFEMILYVFSPILKIIVVIIFELIRGLIWRNKEGQGRQKAIVRIGAVTIVLILLEQPGIIGTLSKYLNCSQLDPYMDEYYITEFNNIQCYTSEYYNFRNILVIPGLVFWGLVVPVAIFLILRANRKRLYDSQSIKVIFGNFYSGYNPDAYYWGILVMNFKMIIFMLNSILTTSEAGKCLIFMCLCHIYYLLFRRKPPYNHVYLNRAEKFCSSSYLLILTLVLIRLTVVNLGVEDACNASILLTAAFAGGYILLNIAWLTLLNALHFFYRFKVSLLGTKIRKETLENLERYHHVTPKRLDEFKRRHAISLELSPRLRQTEDYETKRRNDMQKENLKKMKRKLSYFHQKIKKAIGIHTNEANTSVDLNNLSQDHLTIGSLAPTTTYKSKKIAQILDPYPYSEEPSIQVSNQGDLSIDQSPQSQ